MVSGNKALRNWSVRPQNQTVGPGALQGAIPLRQHRDVRPWSQEMRSFALSLDGPRFKVLLRINQVAWFLHNLLVERSNVGGKELWHSVTLKPSDSLATEDPKSLLALNWLSSCRA